MASKNKRDLSEEQRQKNAKEILNTYKQQIQDKMYKQRKRFNHRRVVERMLVEKQTEMAHHQIKEERLNDLRKKAKQKEELDKQVKERQKKNEEQLCLVYL